MPSVKIIGFLVLEKKILKVFTIYGRGRHLGHVTWTISGSGEDFVKVFTIYGLGDLYHLYKLSFPLPKEDSHEIWH